MLRVVRRSQAVGRTVVDVGGAEKVDAALREIAGDAFGIWSLRALVNEDAALGTAKVNDVDAVLRRAAEGVRDGRYVFVQRDGRNSPLPAPLPPPVASPAPAPAPAKKAAEKRPWTLDVTVFTNAKWSWPKGDVTVQITGPQSGDRTVKMTSNRSAAVSFSGNHDTQHEYEVRASAPGWDPVAAVKVQLKNEDAKTCEVELAPPKVHLHLSYRDPDDAVHPFPKDFAVTVVFDDASTKDLKVEDDKGYLHFDIEKGKSKFTLKFDSAKTRFLVHPRTDAGAAGTPTVEEDPTDDALRTHTTDGKFLFALPRKWSLVHAKWEAAGVAVPADGQVVLPDAGIGTKDAPAQLTLVPKVQFVRFEFHDRRYWKEHAKKRVSLPPVVLKGARKSDAAGAPVSPIAGTHDAVSNWTVERADAAKTCQALPWIVTRKDDGTDLPKLDQEMLLEWAWEKGFVHSKSATERVVVKLEPADAKRKPGKDRSQYYDLPKLWKSKGWWTRFTDATKNRFFDELTPEQVELSLTKATPIAFSLDDIVLVDAAGTSQQIKDKDKSGTAKDRSKHSRLAVLHLDPEDDHQVKVFDPRAEAAYHSKDGFTKEAAADVWRNAIVAYPPSPRAVVFCNGVHDVWDKRTETADFSKKEILGARAARVRDADVTVARKFDQNSDVAAAYVHRTRIFDAYYLHYGATDGTTVFGASLTHWSARCFSTTAAAPAGWDHGDGPLSEDVADARNYRKSGMSHAMGRWNDKRYQFEESDGKTDVVVKSFFLFEAKDVEDPPDSGTFVEVGGAHHCDLGVGTDAKGSWATDTTMFMRRSGYTDEGATWGSLPASEARENDYDGASAAARCALAHELGHAAVGLFDDYITVKHRSAVNGYQEAQRYPGVPFHRDRSSIMSVNQAVRLRQLWGRAKWLSDEAKATKTLHKFLDGRQFRCAYAPAGKTKLDYLLGTGSKNFYAPTHTEADVALGERGKCDLHLYELGDDEFSRLLPDGPYGGILVAETRICATFVKGLDPAAAGWATGAAYAVAAVVDHEGKFYVCLEAHTAGTFATDLGANRWFEVDPAAPSGAWATGTAYTARRWLTSGANQYVCVANHTSGTLDADVAAKRLALCASKPKDWTDVQQKRWIVDVDKRLRDGLEGANGKFRFTCADATKPFAKTYLRAAPAWQEKATPATANPANTQFSFEVTKGGSATFFVPSGAVVKAGENLAANTILRYLFGRISDVAATRAGQDSTSDLAKADLVKLKDWMDGKTVNTFAAEDIP